MATALTLPSVKEDEIREKYPLHSYVWENNTEKLEELLESKLVRKANLIKGYQIAKSNFSLTRYSYR